MARNDPVHVIQDFLGLNNVSASEELDKDEFAGALNVDFTDRGRAMLRTGFEAVEELGEVTGVGGDDDTVLFVRNNGLYTVHNSGPELVRSGVQGSAPMSYAPAAGDIYYSNGTTKGCVRGGKEIGWGTDPVSDSYSLSVVAGTGLQSGIYQVSLVAVSSAGEESPPTRALSVEATTGSALQLDNIDAPAGTDAIRIYCSRPDGSELYLVGEVSGATTSHTLRPSSFGQALETYGAAAPPPGQNICYFQGRLYIAVDNIVWYTYPYRYGCIDPVKGFLRFSEKVRAMLPAENGIFMCCDDGVFFARGDTPDKFVLDDGGSYALIPGTQTRIPSERFDEELEIKDDVWVWLSARGFHAGTSDGKVLDLTEGRVDVDAGFSGAGVFMERQGASMYIGTVKNPGGDRSKFGFTDRAVAEVYRNGVPI